LSIACALPLPQGDEPVFMLSDFQRRNGPLARWHES
jgi:hypothetical protein